MAYRGHVLIWTLFDLLWIGAFPFIWFMIIQAQGGEIRGWNGSAIIVYYVFMAALTNIVLMHPEAHMAKEIFKGNLTNYIVKPQNFLARMFLHETAYKMIRLLFFAPVFIILLVVIARFNGFAEQVPQLPIAALITVLAIPIYFLVAFIVGMASFWLEDPYVVSTIFWASSGLFGGQYAPFELMPRALGVIASALPFKYAIYFPLRAISQVVPQAELWQGIMIQFIWIGVLFMIANWIWQRGLKRYSAVGR